MSGLGEADLERLFRRLERPLYNVLYRHVWQREDARDLVQEAFVRLWRMRARVDPAGAEPLVWRIALNLAHSHGRWQRIRRWVPLEALERSANEVAEPERDPTSALELRAAVRALPRKLREAVLLCDLAELGYREVAAILRVPEGTVASRRSRGLAALRRALGAAPSTDERGTIGLV